MHYSQQSGGLFAIFDGVSVTNMLMQSVFWEFMGPDMTKPSIAPAFCQVAWVVRDIAAAEKSFVETVGIGRFMHMDYLATKDTEGT
jgi:hypothetical protein